MNPALKSIAFALILTGCAAHPDETVSGSPQDQAPTSSERVDSLEHFEFGDHSSSAWISDRFVGTKSRRFTKDTLHFEVDQSANEGGWDVGVSQISFEPSPVSAAKSDLYVCSSYSAELTGPGRWWAGPKISVNWQGDESAKQNGDDWYENYIVETASSTPKELHDIFTGDYFQAEELAAVAVAGSTYRNYKIRFHDWWQFWSVRQDYRASGLLPIEPIVDAWIANGLPPERPFDGIKANLETYGPIKGTGSLRITISDDPAQSTCQDTSKKSS